MMLLSEGGSVMVGRPSGKKLFKAGKTAPPIKTKPRNPPPMGEEEREDFDPIEEDTAEKQAQRRYMNRNKGNSMVKKSSNVE